MNKIEKVHDLANSSIHHIDKIFIIFVALIILYYLAFYLIDIFTIRTVRSEVLHKERINYPSKFKSKYLIFTSEGVFENTDSLLWRKFNSSDIYSRIGIGKTYQFRICRFRIRLWSMYPNIIKAKEIDTAQEYEKDVLKLI